jgi:hypothetical protein
MMTKQRQIMNDLKKERHIKKDRHQMCTYRVNVLELKDIIWEALDNVEGDFNRATLNEALEICKDYHPISEDKE